MLKNLGNWKRSHMCADLRGSDEGREVTLTGWVHRRRDHGGLAFVDLRDRSGLCQVVIGPGDGELQDLLKELRAEYVLAVRGTVRLRPEGMRNEELPSGEIEVAVESLRLLNRSLPLPFPVDSLKQDEASDDLRLKYRFVDLRRFVMKDRIMFRHEVVLALRRHLPTLGFAEIETPLLIRSTPEGARDYVVPSRVHPGSFYALPQSPQLYKQMLMVAGFDRYFQMARCLRDEDLRGDRQPEHTQIDMEMSFVTEEDVFEVVESMLADVFSEVLGQTLPTPFPRMDYAEAMNRFGSDKPDLRFDLEMLDLSEVASASSFQAFSAVIESGGCVKGIRVPGGAGLSRKDIDELEKAARTFRARGLAWVKYGQEGLAGGVSKFFAGEEGENLIAATGLEPGDLLVMVADQWEVCCQALGSVRNRLADKLDLRAGGEFRLLWIHNFPLFEKDGDSGRWSAMHHLFTMPREDDIDLLESDPGAVRGQLYDLVCNGVELGSGSVRIHRKDIQERVMSVVGIDADDAQRRFGFLLRAFEYGAPPHGGIALGLDRLLMVLDGGDSIRDYIAFPKTLQGTSLMVESPTPLEEAQLKELHLLVREEDKEGSD